MRKVFCLLVGLFFATSLAAISAQETVDSPTAAEQLHQIIDESWDFTMRESPVFATRTGDHRFNDQLSKVSLADEKRRNAFNLSLLDRLEAIDRESLTDSEGINYDLFHRNLTDGIAEYDARSFLTPINNRSGFHVSFPELRRNVPLTTVQDYENYIARLNAFGKYADGHLELMREGIRTGVTVPGIILEGWRDSVESHIVADPRESLLYEPLKELSATIPASEHDRLRTAASEAILKSIVPGYQRLLAFMANEYVPSCRTEIGASALPKGREFYRHRVRKFTTLDLTPDEVHQRGLSEVARIRGEMQGIIDKVGFEGDFSAFVDYLRNEKKFYAETPEEFVKQTSYILKKADGELPKLFKKLPRAPYGVREIPAYIAPKTTSAYYQQPAGDGSAAGFFYINTYNLAERPLYTLEALALHEAVPGHHLQIALQQEMEEMPLFRRYGGFTAFVEGWALYAERLGLEMGFYEDPYSDFGRLTMEIWRGCRLVVDTGMHYKGWTRQQAIDYMQENSAMSVHNIRAEVDRYIGWPGQALAYKTGELKIRELRAFAEQELAGDFDIREFHEVVLGSGAVPLDVLERNVRVWVEATASTKSQ